MKKQKTLITFRFGSRLRHLRKERGFSQEEFADACGLDRTYIGGIERGERNVGIKNVEQLALALGLDPHILLEFESND